MPAQPHMDDATITALLAFLSGGRVPQFTVGADYPEGVAGARAVSNRFTDSRAAHHGAALTTIMAVDLNSGKLLWKVPLGQDEEAPRWGSKAPACRVARSATA